MRQDAFAEKVGVHLNTIGRWERAQRTPDVDDLNKILAAFPHINPAWLLAGEGEMARGSSGGKRLSEIGHDELFVPVIQAAIESAGKVDSKIANIYAHAAFDIAGLISESRVDLPAMQEIKDMFSVFMYLENNLENGELMIDGRKIKLSQGDYGRLMDSVFIRRVKV